MSLQIALDVARHIFWTFGRIEIALTVLLGLRVHNTSTAVELTNAIGNERIETAANRLLGLHANQGEVPFGSLVWATVERTLRTGVMSTEGAVEHHPSAIHTANVVDMLHRAERRIGEPTQVRATALYAPLLRGSEHG